MNRQSAPQPNVLFDLVRRLTYKPTWTFELKEIERKQECAGLTLLIGGQAPNSLNTAENVGFLHLMPVPAVVWGEDSWMRWLLDQILLVEQHEALEFFRIDDEAVFFPCHGPNENFYTIAQIKTHERAHALAEQWFDRPAADGRFD